MIINWPLIILLFCLSLPGVFIALPRLMSFLLTNNTDELKKRFSRFAVMQTLFMVFVMSFAGDILSIRTGLNDPVLTAFLAGQGGFGALQNILLPTFLYALFGLIVFCGLYYGVVESLIDEKSFKIMARLKTAIGIDGCVLYGGVVEEIIARWGLMNLVAFFSILFAKQNNSYVIWFAIIFSGLMFGLGQAPAYIAAGCSSSRRFIYTILLLSFWQSLVFGFLFWQYGLLSSILGHMFFHIGWGLYERRL